MESSIEFKCDKVTVAAVWNHLRFLKQVADNPFIHFTNALRNAIRRYETFWLPFVAKHEEMEILLPPLDIAWIWHVHMLSPIKYDEDCKTITGSTLRNRAALEEELDASSEKEIKSRTAQLFKNMFPFETFDILWYSNISLNWNYQQKCSYNLLSAANRQRKFYDNLSCAHYNSEFVKNAIDRYKKFMRMNKEHTGKFFVPMYDIDLVWHTHQHMATSYKRDTEAYFGYIRNHDDEVTETPDKSKMEQYEAETKRIWFEMYGTPLAITGTTKHENIMVPEGKLQEFDRNVYDQEVAVKCLVRVESLEFTCRDKTGAKIRASLTVHHDSVEIHSEPNLGDMKTKSSIYVWPKNSSTDNMLPVSFPVYTNKETFLKIILTEISGIPLISRSKTILHSFRLDLTDVIHNEYKLNDEVNKERTVHIDSNLSGGRKLTTACTIGHFRKTDTTFTLKKLKPYETTNVSSINREDVWGPVPMRHVNYSELWKHSDVRVAEQTISYGGEHHFCSRVIHSLPLRVSAIHILQEDKIVAMSYLVGVNDVSILFGENLSTSADGARAMLIVNNKGKWGAVIGSWEGLLPPYHTPYSRYSSRKLVHGGNSGWLKVTFIQSGRKLQGVFYDKRSTNSQRNTSITLGGMTLALDVGHGAGSITIRSDCEDVTENLALALSVLTLFVLCEPRDKVTFNSMKYAEGYKSKNYHANTGSKSSFNYYGSSDQPYLRSYFSYVGYNEETPSNSHLYVASKVPTLSPNTRGYLELPKSGGRDDFCGSVSSKVCSDNFCPWSSVDTSSSYDCSSGYSSSHCDNRTLTATTIYASSSTRDHSSSSDKHTSCGSDCISGCGSDCTNVYSSSHCDYGTSTATTTYTSSSTRDYSSSSDKHTSCGSDCRSGCGSDCRSGCGSDCRSGCGSSD